MSSQLEREKLEKLMSEKKKVKILYNRLPTYRLYTASNVFGGRTPGNTILCDFVIDRMSPPNSVDVELKSDGSIDKEVFSGIHPIRDIQMGLELSPETAFAIGQWLITKAKEAGIKEK